MSKTPEIKHESPIRALTADEIDWSLFAKFEFDQKGKREQIERSSSNSDFHMEAWQTRRRKRKKDDSFLGIEITPELKTFLEQNRPQTLFFSPESIASFLTPDSDIVCEHSKTEQFEKWVFTLNPQKYEVSSDIFSPNRKQTITLTRGKVSEYGEYQEPYLVVSFPARYDGSNIIFYPEVKITYGESLTREKLEEAMIQLLSLKSHVIEQKLNFKVKKEEVKETKTDRSGKTKVVGKWNIYPVEVTLKT